MFQNDNDIYDFLGWKKKLVACDTVKQAESHISATGKTQIQLSDDSPQETYSRLLILEGVQTLKDTLIHCGETPFFSA